MSSTYIITPKSTTNDKIYKFEANAFLVQGTSYEFGNIDEAKPSPLAQELFPEEAKSLAVLYSDEKFVWEYYNNLWLTKTFAETHKLTLMIVPTTIWDIDADHPDWIYKDIHPLLKKYCKKVWQTLKESVMVTDQGLENFFENPDKPNHAGWGHYPQHNHKAYAQHIYDRLELFGNFIRI